MSNQVVNVYSEAFFDLSLEKDNLDRHKEDFTYLKKIMENNEEIELLTANPQVRKSDKKKLISELFGDLEKDLVNLLYVLIDKSRFGILEDLIRDFKKRYNQEKGIKEGIVYSSRKLDSSDMDKLLKVLEKKYNKKVELENIEDPDLIGGISISIDGERIDNSIKNRLENLRARLMKEGE